MNYNNIINLSNIDKNQRIINASRPLSKESSKRLYEDLLVRWTYNSNAIEGNTLTISETKVVLENGVTIAGKSLREHLEVINHKEAILYIEKLIKNKTPLTENEIKSLHYLVLKSINEEFAGRYREENVIISGASFKPINYMSVPYEMEKLVSLYKTEWQNLHGVIRASLLHGELVKIHPFIDDNGRTARLLMNFELMKSGFEPVIVKNETKNVYYDALDKGATTGDYSDFIKYVVVLEEERQGERISLI